MWIDWTLSPPFLNKKRGSWSFQTVSHWDFTKLAQLFVVNSQGTISKKSIKPLFVDNYLTPRAFTYWFMDDGGRLSYNKDYQRKGLVLNTQGFLKSDTEILCQGLQNRYHSNCWLKPNKNGYGIAISGKNYSQLLDLMDPFLIDSMRYKLPKL